MVKINVGCGKRNFGGDWIHVDGGDFDHLNSHDVTLKNYPDEYFDLIYSSHLIAYFDRDEVAELLITWKQKLKPGGTLRIATPDHEAMAYLYQSGVHLNYFLGPMYGKMKMGNEKIYHKTIWDFKSLENLLCQHGFKDVKRYDHEKTEHAEFDDHSAAYIQGTLISLNVQCKKI